MGKALCVVAFTPDGIILDANDHFLRAVDYDITEIQDRHHSMFMSDATGLDKDYAAFWHRLVTGERIGARRAPYLTKADRLVWFYGSYCPVLDYHGRVCKVVKVAADVTAEHMRNLEADLPSGGFGTSRPHCGGDTASLVRPALPLRSALAFNSTLS